MLHKSSAKATQMPDAQSELLEELQSHLQEESHANLELHEVA